MTSFCVQRYSFYSSNELKTYFDFLQMEKKKLQVVVRVRPKKNDENVWVRVASDKSIRTVNHRNVDETLEFK